MAEVWLGLGGLASAARLRLLLTPAAPGQPRGLSVTWDCRGGRALAEQMLMERRKNLCAVRLTCLWQAGQVWKWLPRSMLLGPCQGTDGCPGRGVGLCGTIHRGCSSLYWAMDAAARGKVVPYFFSLSSPPAIPVRCSFPGNRSLLSLLMAEPKEITVV